MSHHGKTQKGKMDGKKGKEPKSSYVQRTLDEANSTASPHQERDNVAAILAELRHFRQENNEKLTDMTSAIKSLEQTVGNLGERLTEAEDRINQVEDDSARSSRLLGYLLRRERQLEERCEALENYTRRNNLRIYGVPEGKETGDVVKWAETFLTELLDLPRETPLMIERAHRSLQQTRTQPGARSNRTQPTGQQGRPPASPPPPRSLIVRFVDHQQKQQVISKAWSSNNLEYEGNRIYMDHDYSPMVQKRRREYSDIKKQLKEKNIRFQTPYPAKLKVHLQDGVRTYSSAWQAAEDLQSIGIKTTISDEEKMSKELNRVGWQVAMDGSRRGDLITRNLIQDVEALQ